MPRPFHMNFALFGAAAALAGCQTDTPSAQQAPAQAATSGAQGVVWQSRWSPDLAYINRSGDDVILRDGPGIDATVIGSLPAGDGGTIRTCDATATWCLISYNGGNAEGWATMRELTGEPR